MFQYGRLFIFFFSLSKPKYQRFFSEITASQKTNIFLKDISFSRNLHTLTEIYSSNSKKKSCKYDKIFVYLCKIWGKTQK